MTAASLECRVVAVPDEGEGGRWFVSSSHQDGIWYEIRLVPGTELVCSCLAGAFNATRRAMGAPEGPPCRHLRAVAAHVADQAEAVSA